MQCGKVRCGKFHLPLCCYYSGFLKRYNPLSSSVPATSTIPLLVSSCPRNGLEFRRLSISCLPWNKNGPQIIVAMTHYGIMSTHRKRLSSRIYLTWKNTSKRWICSGISWLYKKNPNFLWQIWKLFSTGSILLERIVPSMSNWCDPTTLQRSSITHE